MSQLSYTWSHAMDSASNDMGGGFASMSDDTLGPSDYDIRHNLNFSGSIAIWAPRHGILWSPFRHWYIDFLLAARGGLPFDIQGTSECTSATSSTATTCDDEDSGLFSMVRPDYVYGEDLWIADTKVPGGKRLNKDAFELPDGYTQGNLGRNALRGFGFGQLDLAIRRDFPITDSWRVSVALQGYNITNHPNFANPSSQEGANMSSPNFGIMTQMLNQGFGGGMSSIYRSGGPRSMELSLRLQF
jgi:hypothetical protein